MKNVALVFVVACIFNENDAQLPDNLANINAELLILPPIVLGYEDLLDNEEKKDETPAAEEEEEAATEKNNKTRLNNRAKYTLKFEGNFALPSALAEQLKRSGNRGNTRKKALENGLGDLLQNAVLQQLQGVTLAADNEGQAEYETLD